MTSTEPKNNCKHTGTASFEQGFGWRCDACGGLSGNHGGTPGGNGPASGSPGGSGLEPKKEWEKEFDERFPLDEKNGAMFYTRRLVKEWFGNLG